MGQKARLRRLVLDTNVVVSALLFDGPAQRLAQLWQNGSIEPLASAGMIRELSRVLAYPKFRLNEDEIERLISDELLPFVKPVKIGTVPPVIQDDPADDEFLACATAGSADAVVSGDKHLLDLRQYRGIPIIPVRTCLDHWSS